MTSAVPEADPPREARALAQRAGDAPRRRTAARAGTMSARLSSADERGAGHEPELHDGGEPAELRAGQRPARLELRRRRRSP